MEFLSVIAVGIASFVATNIDDLVILMAFFANSRFPAFQIVLGQYVGMGSLLGISLLGSLIAVVVPTDLIGLIGLFPIALGIKELLELRSKTANDQEGSPKRNILESKLGAALPFLIVAVVTFSGGEEIGIFASVFATNSDALEVLTIVSIVLVFTAVWLGIAGFLVKRSFLAARFRSVSTKALPFVLIGLGTYILIEAFIF